MINRRIIVCGIVCDNDEILLGKKAKGAPPYPDVWHTLGGGVNDYDKANQLVVSKSYNDNYFFDELKRELKEEANISISNPVNICPKYRNTPREAIAKDKNGIETHYIFLEYICNLDSKRDRIRPGDDIAELQWEKKEDLKNIKLTPPSLEMYKEIGWIKTN